MIQKIYLVHHTHMDIGYTDQPVEVLEQQLAFLDLAVKYCHQQPAFRWTIESAYLLKDYIRNRTPGAVEKVFELLRSGQMELMAFEVQPLTEMFSGSALFNSVKYAVELGTAYGFPVQCAMLDDIGGWAGRLPSALAASGVKYLVAGAGAFQVHLPWADLPPLFYLRDTAEARILVWNLGIDRYSQPQQMMQLLAVYGLGANVIILPHLNGRTGADKKVEAEGGNSNSTLSPEEVYHRFEERLKAERYPYSEMLFQYGGDNRWPSEFLPELLDQIRSAGKLPPIELVTPSYFFKFMEQQYAGMIPEITGVITDPWNLRVPPASVPLRRFREAQRVFERARNLAGQSGCTLADGLLAEAAEKLDLYADHTCGLSGWHTPELNTGAPSTDPSFEPLRRSWKIKALYADQALELASAALRRLRNHTTAGFPDATLLICNDTPQPQSGPVEFYFGRDLAAAGQLETPDGQPVKFQFIDHNRILIQSPEVPPFGILPLRTVRQSLPDGNDKALTEPEPQPERLVTRHYAIDFDPATGNIRQLTTVSGKLRYDNPMAEFGLFSPVLQCPENFTLSWKESGMRPLTDSKFPQPVIHRCGRLWHDQVADAFEQNGEFPGGIRFRRTLIFYHELPQIDVRLYLDKPEHRELESIYLAVPLAGKTTEWKLDQNVGIIDPDTDLLPGAMRDLFYVHSAAQLLTTEYTAVMTSPDAPVLHPGSIRLFQWLQERKLHTEPPAFYWQLYHNMLVTDCPAWQRILGEFHFSLRLTPGHKEFVPVLPPLTASWHELQTTAGTPPPEFECSQELRLLELHRDSVGVTAILENLKPQAFTGMVRYGSIRKSAKFQPAEVRNVFIYTSSETVS